MPCQITPIEIRFWRHVKKTPCCYYWTGAKTKKGYGVIGRGGRKGGQTTAHRVSYEIHYGPVTPGNDACHNCPCGDKVDCVRPEHLFDGTRLENIRDTIKKGRKAPVEQSRRPGILNGNAKLNDDAIRDIRQRCAGKEVQRLIAASYDIAPSLVSHIHTRRAWPHVTD